ncbi:hypothetical protein LTR66_005250 [Elasticomyces elasticus]|nr:hypothetical protein LTR66_005250 [Elasticomyces elasticus]
MSIFPYIYYMVSSFHITDDERQIALYAGMVTSAFAFAEFSTGVVWGRLSDRIGRKPVLLTGMAGTGLSMLIFGFAPNLPVAMLARALGGLLNGNIGVLQSTVAEVVTVEAHQARAYSIMPFVWCLGSIIGSSLGGTLADPVRNYPAFFRPGTILERFPYLLPNIVCAAVVLVGMIIGFLFLEETHEEKKGRRDVGLEIGKWILGRFSRGRPEERRSTKSDYFEETMQLLDDQPPGYRTTESSPQLQPTVPSVSEPEHDKLALSAASGAQPTAKRQRAAQSAFTKQVMLNILGYGILAYHTISAEQLLPVLFSMPESHDRPRLPFHFTGGFALPTKTIGFILSMQGFLQMFMTIVVFPYVNRRLGSLKTFRLVILTYPFLYLLVPYLALVPPVLRMPCIYFLLVWKVTGQALSYPSSAIMLANSAPSKSVLGTLNGVAASSASLCRAFGPTISGLIHTAGLSLGCSGLAWWASSLVAALGAVLSLCMVEEKRRPGFALDPDDEESGPAQPLLDADDFDATALAVQQTSPEQQTLLSYAGPPACPESSVVDPTTPFADSEKS